MNKSDFRKYAKLIVRRGANVQKGQEVIINSSTDNAYFVEYVVEEAYKAGASYVSVEWSNQATSISTYKYAKVNVLKQIEDWKIEKIKHRAKVLPAMIHIGGGDPDGMNKVNQQKMMEVQRAQQPIIKPIMEEMDNKFQWTIACIPHPIWAKKIFPGETKNNAVKKLWDVIFKTTRVYGDPLENWDLHNANIISKNKKLNELNIKTLKYSSSNGTDFTIDLLACTEFKGGGDTTIGGVFFNPNMPTEESFISPDKTSCNGWVYSTKPLSVMGKLVDNFGFKFENGKIVEIYAKDEEHKKVLENLTSLDEGAKMLGEVALVPYNSPINETGLLFYNTLFDENACCHLALGRGFSDTIKGYDKMSLEEIKAVGLNDSMIHVDFMIGSSDLSIVATTYDGQTVQIFKDGVWAF